ncbi:cysteine-rich secretory protein family [Anaerolinea thermolimosa]|nr:cysteine-rich secretory protein family [Anaerolinea thermolimosa]
MPFFLSVQRRGIFLLLPIILSLTLTPAFAEAHPFSSMINNASNHPSLTSESEAQPAASSKCTITEVSVQNAAFEQRMLELVNQVRAENNLPPLKRNSDLDRSARAHARDVHDDRYFYHDTYDRVQGRLVYVCSWSERIGLYYPGTAEGENVAGGFDTPEEAMQAWMGSSGHRANLLNPAFREIGIGFYSGPNAHHSYWVQDFGTRGAVYPLVINGDAPSTTTPQVSLYLYRQDESWDEMRLRNDDDPWSAWMPFTPTLSWILNPRPGEHRVTAEVRRGQSVRQVSDTINLVLPESLPEWGKIQPAGMIGGNSTTLPGKPAHGVVASAGSPQSTDGEEGILGDPASTGPAVPLGNEVTPLFSGCTRINVPVQNAAFEQQVVELVNQERASAGLPPLKRNLDLDYAARYHAQDMHDDRYFFHDTYDGSTWVCDTWQRLSNYYPTTGWMGENIAGGYTTPSSVMAGWMNSPGHKANILNSNYREIGVGYYYGPSGYQHYWVQDFGSRSGYYPLVINREAATTDSPQVSLYIYREDSTWTEMRLRNDDLSWGPWQPFSNNVSWTLQWFKGTRTVSVEVRKGTTVRSASDTIELTTSQNTLGNLPASLLFIFDQATSRLIPPSYTLQPLNTGNSFPLSWMASTADSWLSVTPSSGTTPSSTLTIIPGSLPSGPGLYSTTVTVTVTSPTSPPTEGSPAQIQVKLSVVEALDHLLYLPLIQR